MHKPSESYNGPTPQLSLLWKWHQANVGNNGTSIYPLQSWITTRHTIPISIVNQVKSLFRARIPHKILDHKLGLQFNPNIAATTDFAEELLRRTNLLYDKTKKNVMQSYIKYKRYYDKKAKASPLKKKGYCFILQPKADHPWVKNTVPWLPFDWTLSCRNTSIEQYLYCSKTQN